MTFQIIGKGIERDKRAAILTADAVLRSRDSESQWPSLLSLLLTIAILSFAHLWRVEEYPQAWMLPPTASRSRCR